MSFARAWRLLPIAPFGWWDSRVAPIATLFATAAMATSGLFQQL